MPWKQANEMLFPCSSIVPPSTVPDKGSGKQSVERWRPPTWLNTRCQWRWCLASCRVDVAQVWELDPTSTTRSGWTFMSSGMWRRVYWQEVPHDSKDCSASTFKGQKVKRMTDPWRRRHHDPSTLRNGLPNNTTSNPRSLEYSTTLLWELHIWYKQK